MGVREFQEWIAFRTLSSNTEYREKLETQIALEKSAQQSADQRAHALLNMFRSLSPG
jgi:hypothetical protein